MPIDLSIVVAMTLERVIGNNGELPWRQLPSDLTRFKLFTMNAGAVIMGRKTYESILARNGKPLPGRRHIVLTRGNIPHAHESVQFVGSPGEACAEVAANGERACVIGGGEIFQLFLAMPQMKKIFITTIKAELGGDIYFPKLGSWWIRTKHCDVRRWSGDEYATSFEMYERFQR